MANRRTPAPSNFSGAIGGVTFTEDVNEEVKGLWQYAQVPLSNVGGTANAITATCDVPLDAFKKGQTFTFKPTVSNTGSCIIVIDNFSPRQIKNRDGTDLTAGRLVANRSEILTYDGSALILMLDKPVVNTVGSALFSYRLPSGTDGAALPAGYSTYPLNTIVQNDLSIGFSNAQITLAVGTYEIEFSAAVAGYAVTPVLWNFTTGVKLNNVVRQSCYSYGSIRAKGNITLLSSQVIGVRVYTNSATGSQGLGIPVGIPSEQEEYGFLVVRRVL